MESAATGDDDEHDVDEFVDELVDNSADHDGGHSNEDILHSTAGGNKNNTTTTIKTLAGISGNVLEWFDFAIFGFLSDVIGKVFFPANQKGHSAITESFLIFGGAFLMRPFGGVFMGHIGDTYGRKKALRLSIFLMAFPTFAMGCLPSYETAGAISIVLLILVRLLQGFSVGGQLMSSAVFTLECHDQKHWGYYGSLVMAAANFGTLLGSFAGWILRSSLTEDQLYRWGWRLPFLSGIIVSVSGFYLGDDEDDTEEHQHDQQSATASSTSSGSSSKAASGGTPMRKAFAPENRRSLLASSLVPMLWSSGFYLSFVWMAIFMTDLSSNPIPGSFGINAAALFVSVCLLFPVAGSLSDRYGRRSIMSVGALFMGIGAPLLIVVIGQGNPILALLSQIIIGVALSCFGAPMIAWLVESFEPEARLTSVAIGYNLAQATVGGLTPALATFMVDSLGPSSPGIILSVVAFLALFGLWAVAPPPGHQKIPVGPDDESSIISHPSCNTESADNSQHGLSGTRRRKKETFIALAGSDVDGCSHSSDDIELI